MSKHTPGPWITDKHPGDEWYFGHDAEIVIRAKGGWTFSHVAVLGAKLDDDHTEADANARLIAAAPALLAACEAAIDYILDGDDPSESHGAIADAVLGSLRAAVALAKEGGAS